MEVATLYQCIYCKAQYEHDQSYAHNAYRCPKQKGKRMKGMVAGLMVMVMLSMTGCELLDKYFPPQSVVTGGEKANITIFKGDKGYTFSCDIDRATEKFTNCVEVK